MRSIAHDLGQSLGSGAHLLELRRTGNGEFAAAEARTLAQLESLAAEERLIDAIVPMGSLLPSIPNVFVDDMLVGQIRHGRDFQASPFRSQPGSRYVKAVTRSGDLVA